VDGKELLFDNMWDHYQMDNLAGKNEYKELLDSYRIKLKKKMKSLNDTFEDSTWYRDNWISEDRNIIRTARD
jgi:hypothetical protein